MDMQSKLQSPAQPESAPSEQPRDGQSPSDKDGPSALGALAAAKRMKSQASKPAPKTRASKGSFDEAQYLADMKSLQQAHQILMRRKEDAERKGEPDPDFNPQETYGNFVNYTSVRQIFEEVTGPLTAALPKLNHCIAQHDTNFRTVQTQVDDQLDAIRELQEQVKEIVVMRGNHSQLCKTVEMEGQRAVENQEWAEAQFMKVRKEAQLMRELINQQHHTIERQDEKLEACHVNLERGRVMLQERFDEWFANVGAEQKRLQRGLNDVEQEQKCTEERVKEFNEQAKTQLEATIKAVFSKAHTNQKQLDKFEAQLKSFGKELLPVTKLAGTVEELVSQRPVLQQHTTFLSETLPVLLHLTVCEALDKVVGRENKRAMIDFERDKLRELRAHEARRRGQRGLQALTKRVSALAFVYATQDQGVLPFNYGSGLAGVDEAEHVDKAHLTELSLRYEKLLEEEQAFREAVELACGDTRKVSPALLRHKLTKLKESQVVRLRNAIANRRVLELEQYDDFLLEVARPPQQQQRAPQGPQHQRRKTVQKEPTSFGYQLDSSRVGGLSTGSMDGVGHGAVRSSQKMADKVFIVKTEQLRPYQRLDRKYGQLFGTAVQQFVDFKSTQLDNFSKAAQMTLQLTAEINLVKDVVQHLQAALEESDSRLRAGLAEQDERLLEAIKAAEAKAKQAGLSSTKRMEKELKRLETEATQQEQRVDDLVKTMAEQQLEQCATSVQHEQSIYHLGELLTSLRANVEQGRRSTLDEVGNMITAHANDELAPRLEEALRQRAAQLVGERFMEIQKRVDLHAEEMHDVVKAQTKQSEEAIKGLQEEQTKAKKAHKEQLQTQGRELTMKLIQVQAKAAVQGQYLAARVNAGQKKEVVEVDTAGAAPDRAKDSEAEPKREVEGAPVKREHDANEIGKSATTAPASAPVEEKMKKEKKGPPSEPAQPNEDKMAVDPGLPAKPAPPIARKEEDKKEQAASQPEQVQPDRAAATSDQNATKSRAEQAKEAELKQRQKQEKLKKQEEKRKKERLIAQRQKEREERQAEHQRQREEEEAERARAEAYAAKKRQQEEEIKAKYAKRISEMQRMMRQSRTNQLGQQFLLELGAQKGGNVAADAKLVNKQALVSRQQTMAPKTTGKKSTQPSGTDKPTEKSSGGPSAKIKSKSTQKGGPAKQAAAIDREKIAEEAEASESSGGSDGFVNPFEFIKQAKQGNALSPEAFEEMLKPKVAAMQAAVKLELDKVYKQIDDVGKSWSDSLSSTKDQLLKEVAGLTSGLEAVQQELKRQYEVNASQLQRLTYDMEDTKQRLDLETQEIQKLRIGVKKDIATELAKITSDEARTKYELRRTNALIANISEITSLLAEDQMLSQLLQEQEALDKKQMGLFGLKKNSQILGTNQYAMQNNLLSSTQAGEGKGTEGKEEQRQSKAFWDLRNKTKRYNEVVKSPVLSGQNVRGADAKQKQTGEQYLAGARSRSPQPLELNLGQRAVDEGLSDRSVGRDIAADQLLNAAYMTRYNQGPRYNTIYLDRSCASCQPGSAAHALTMLKMACLSYVSSPIRYGPILPRPPGLGAAVGRGSAENPTSGGDAVTCLESTLSRARAAASPSDTAGDGQSIARVGPHCYVDLQVCEVLQLKEGLLRSCQRYLQEKERIQAAFPSEFGSVAGRQPFTVRVSQNGDQYSPDGHRSSAAGNPPRLELVGGLEPGPASLGSATQAGRHGARRRALNGQQVAALLDEERPDSAEDAEDAWPRDPEDGKSTTLRPVGNLYAVAETQCLDTPKAAPPHGRAAADFGRPDSDSGSGPALDRVDFDTARIREGSATALRALRGQLHQSRSPSEEAAHPSTTSPKFVIRVMQDLVKWRQAAKQKSSVQLFISERLRQEHERQQQQAEHHRRLRLKQSELSRKRGVDEALRTVSAFSSDHEAQLARTAQGFQARYRASRSRSRDATRFKPVAADADVAGLDDTTKADLLGDQSFSQARWNTLISSSQLIKAGQLKTALNPGAQPSKIMRSSLNVASNVRAPAGASFFRQSKDNRSAYAKAHATRPRTHSKNNTGTGVSISQVLQGRARESRTLNATGLSDPANQARTTVHEQDRPSASQFAPALSGHAEQLLPRQSKAKSTMAVKAVHPYLASPQALTQHFLPSDPRILQSRN